MELLLGGGIMATRTLAGSIGLDSRNLAINGGFDHWQRGTTVTNPSNGVMAYTADRWSLNSSGGNTISAIKTASVVGDGLKTKYYMKTVTNGTARLNSLCHAFDSTDIQKLQGKKWTLSFKAKINSGNDRGYRLFFMKNATSNTTQDHPSGASISINGFSPTTSWQRFTFTVDIPKDGTAEGFYFLINDTAGGTANAGDEFSIAEVMLNEGEVAAPFKTRGVTPVEELQLCLRYYCIMNDVGGYFVIHPGNYWLKKFYFPVRMAKIPTCTTVFYSSSGQTNTNGGFASADESSVTWSTNESDENGVYWSLIFKADAELYYVP